MDDNKWDEDLPVTVTCYLIIIGLLILVAMACL